MGSCLKKKFDTKEEAIKRLNEILSTSDRDKKPIRVYWCEKCFKFHLTSFTKNQQKVVSNIKDKRQEKRIKDAAIFFASKNGWDLELD